MDAGDLARRETKIKQASPDFTVFSRLREILRETSPSSTHFHQPRPLSLRYPTTLSSRPSLPSFMVPRRALTRLRVNVDLLTE